MNKELFSLQISKNTFEKLKMIDFNKKVGLDHLVFKRIGGENSLYLFAEGTPKGTVILNHKEYSLEQILNSLISQGINEKGIDSVIVICSFGGLLDTYSTRNVIIGPLNYKNKQIKYSVDKLGTNAYELKVIF